MLLLGSITSQGWLDLFPIRFIFLEEVELPVNSGDRVVWRFAQANQMILLTANRSMKGKDSRLTGITRRKHSKFTSCSDDWRR